MPTLTATGIADLVSTTINELGELKMTDLMSDYQKTEALKRTVKKNKMTFDAGPRVEFNLITDHNDSARFVGLYAQDVVNVPNVMATGAVDWRHITWNWGLDRREVKFNRSPRKIVDLTKTRRMAAFGSAIIAFEKRFWRSPSSDSTTLPHGVPYWIVKSNTAHTTNDGFNGTVPSGYTDVAGINPTSQPRWRNWACQYTAITKDDLIRKLRKALVYTDFETLVDGMSTYNTGDDLSMYANYNTISALEELLEDQNDDLGSDLASMDGKVIVRRTPIKFMKELDGDTTNPIYGINWGEFKTMGLRGEWMYETMLDEVPGQHTVSAVHTDCTFNWFCRNRRRNFVLATDTTMPA